jgi:hypothetical protein
VSSVRIARLYDEAGGGVPRFTDRARIEDPGERGRVLAYLRSGTPLLHTTQSDMDRVDPSRGPRVALSLRTDGTWLWNDGVAYYLDIHHLAPDPGLYKHIRARRYACAQPDRAAVHAAIRALHGAGR